ncbi:hypothetical protein L6164_036506 [Bauhinia variegata]|uniref:Uncharacterized protein n=1 Tax=Bauhinia variegata TaxID=167791 RepID=A0ACB9KHD0_BAUVA|nr:hypothetical protein L6164_036506 [Bauhinia variegata]
MFLFKENHQWWRGGSYNGEIFVGAPSMKRSVISLFNHTFVDDENEVYLMYNTYDESVIARLMVHPSGFFQTFTWDSQKNQWRRYWSAPESQCDNYGTCGSNSFCDPLNYEDHQCSCLPGFEPRKPNDWYQNIDMSEEKYATKSKGKPAKKELIAIPMAVFAAILMLIIYFINWKRKQKDDVAIYLNQDSPTAEGHGENRMHQNLPFFDIKTMVAATKNFARENQLGQGGFGLVYKVWDLWRQQKALDMVDSTLGHSFPPAVVLRCIHIGLLCVQESHMNRPSMWEVVFMLRNQSTLPRPKKPAFILNHNEDNPESLGGSSVNEVTCTTMYAR